MSYYRLATLAIIFNSSFELRKQSEAIKESDSFTIVKTTFEIDQIIDYADG